MSNNNTVSGMFAGLVIGSVMLVAGACVVIFMGRPMVANAKASTNWPTVEGVVTQSEVRTSKDSDSGTMYSAHVQYEYTVFGQLYRSSKVSFSPNAKASWSSGAEAIVNKYPLRSGVTVRYNEVEPNTAVLEPGATWGSYTWHFVGYGLGVIGLLICGWPLVKLMFVAVAVGSSMGAGSSQGGAMGVHTGRGDRALGQDDQLFGAQQADVPTVSEVAPVIPNTTTTSVPSDGITIQ